MADTYSCYEQLHAAEVPDAFQITITDRNTPAVIVAPHGGKIEPGASQVAAAVAHNEISVYAFEGKKEFDKADLHITSTKFDEPMALALVARSEYFQWTRRAPTGWRCDPGEHRCAGGTAAPAGRKSGAASFIVANRAASDRRAAA